MNSLGEFMTVKEMEAALQNADILAACVEDPRTWRELYGAGHNISDLYTLGEVIRERETDSFALFEKALDSHTICFANMYVMPRQIYDEYMEWLFDILVETGDRIDISGYDTYEKRVFGLLSENLIQIFARSRSLRLSPQKAMIIAEKSETTELKNAIAQLIREDRPEEAAKLYEQFLSYRKDVLFSQSDLSGELPDIGKLLSIMVQEKSCGNGRLYGKSRDLRELLKMFRGL